MRAAEVGVGEIVLFRLDAHVWRPLLVTRATVVSDLGVEPVPKTLVSGTLFLCWDEDRRTSWVLNVSKLVEAGMAQVKDAARGHAIGQWQPRGAEQEG